MLAALECDLGRMACEQRADRRVFAIHAGSDEEFVARGQEEIGDFDQPREPFLHIRPADQLLA